MKAGEDEGEDINFTCRVTHSNKHCLTRQVREGVLIKKRGESYEHEVRMAPTVNVQC